MARLNSAQARYGEVLSGHDSRSRRSGKTKGTLPTQSPRISHSAGSAGTNSDSEPEQTRTRPQVNLAEEELEMDEPQTAIQRDSKTSSDSLLSSLAALKLTSLEPSAEPDPASRRGSPRKAAPRQRRYLIHDSIDLGSDSTTADDDRSESEDDSALSDFIVDDSASEAELRRPPRSLRKAQDQPKSFKRLVQKSPTKAQQIIYEDTDDEVRVSKPHSEPVNSSPQKRTSRSLADASDKENGRAVPNDSTSTLNLAERLGGALRFSPPANKDLSSSSRTSTPPPESPSRQRLQSPTRNRVNIPKFPHRESIDTFWSQHAVDGWNDVHSPKKTPRPNGRLLHLLSPNKARPLEDLSSSSCSEDSGNESPSLRPPKSPTKSPSKGINVGRRAALEAKKKFEREKHEIASTFLAELDDKIADGEISRLSASTGGVKLEWSKRLNSTAGRAKWKRERIRASKPASLPFSSQNTGEGNNKCAPTKSNDRVTSSSSSESLIVHHHASIELAEKVIDDEERLLNTIAHEFTHLLVFMIDGVKDRPHGREFKAWARKVSSTFADRSILVTTKHAYDIAFKYIWACTTCAQEYRRHSKSIDPAKHVCSSCTNGALVQIKPVPKGGKIVTTSSSTGEAGTAAAGNTPEELGYSAFVKANFALIKAELANGEHREGDMTGTASAKGPAWGQVMAELARRWKVEKAARGRGSSVRKTTAGVEGLKLEHKSLARTGDEATTTASVEIIDLDADTDSLED